ncbi:GntR family transcriptional regulator [Hahella sp. CCB-MM4]|uniref:aminotransferase-like domain-containing protein n=1 Tax=Hahella sp. (strain CCB-MM4) TaxID=1926491 RepID=UPI000BDC31E9|nr:PLP-dependent aminotransferase family protein [Hahella sp. CCB-MM4]OZG75357.1 GntR family transcriptional regulator [Hahella sp. CCB-MM4]
MKRYELVAEQIRERIREGVYSAGQRIPGTRDLVQHFSVSVSTVMSAQRLLEREGWVEARSRSGYYVLARSDSGRQPKAQTFIPKPILVSDQRMIMKLVQTVQDPSVLALGAAVPDVEYFPRLALQRAYRSALRQQGKRLDQYSFPPGILELREALVSQMADAGCPVGPEQLTITDGCHEALRLALRSVTQAGDVVAVESPTYYGVLQLINALGLKALEIPTDPQLGISLSALKLALDQWPVKAVLVMANFSNPTGATLSDQDKLALVSMCQQREVPLIENDVYGELGYSALRPRALKSFDDSGQVLYCASFSKTVSPGLRVGWIAAGKWLEQANYLKFTSSLATATVPQMALVSYLKDSDHKRHLRHLSQQLQVQMEKARQWVQDYFPESTRVTRPAGGFVLWVELPPVYDSDRLYHLALQQGISIAPGSLFSPSGKYRHCLRLNCAIPQEKLQKALYQLGQILSRYDGS